jgi:hypothetical protein
MIATLEVVLYWLVSSVAATFIGLAVVAPERVDRTMMDILTRFVTAVAETNLCRGLCGVSVGLFNYRGGPFNRGQLGHRSGR